MSTTYIAALASILVTVLPRFGVQVTSDEVTTLVSAGVVLVSGIWIIYQRYQRGDVTIAGVRKQ
jgi:ABC-type nickel/cobalt efflux system permease component RcnA